MISEENSSYWEPLGSLPKSGDHVSYCKYCEVCTFYGDFAKIVIVVGNAILSLSLRASILAIKSKQNVCA